MVRGKPRRDSLLELLDSQVDGFALPLRDALELLLLILGQQDEGDLLLLWGLHWVLRVPMVGMAETSGRSHRCRHNEIGNQA